MNLGRPISFLIIILIAFGYIMSDDQHVRKDLRETSTQLERSNDQVIAVNQALSVCQKGRQDDQQVISEQKTQITSLNRVISVKDGEIGTLTTVISQQTGRITQLEEALVSSTDEHAEDQPVQTASAWLQLDPTLWVVLLAVQLGLFIFQRRQRNGYIRLSEEERAHIIKMRRMKKM
jgi:hypothetical protein